MSERKNPYAGSFREVFKNVMETGEPKVLMDVVDKVFRTGEPPELFDELAEAFDKVVDAIPEEERQADLHRAKDRIMAYLDSMPRVQ